MLWWRRGRRRRRPAATPATSSASPLGELFSGERTGALFEHVVAEMGDLAASFDTEHLSEVVLVDLLESER